MRNPFTRLKNLLMRRRELRAMPLRLEFVLTDYCNLNCRGCTHYSPLAKRAFEDLAVAEAAMAHLGRVCGDGVEKAYLIGGETLLYPHLVEAMEALRRHFPTQQLYIFTNGLVLNRMSDEFWEAAKRLGIIIALTRYPVKVDYDAIEQLCRDRGVVVEVYGDRSLKDSFLRFPLDPAKRQNGRLAHFKCFNRGCVSVVGDRVYPCSISACVGHLNAAAGTDFRHVEGDYLKVADVRSAADIKRLRDRPVPFCSYCKKPTFVPYGPSRRDPAEWVD